MFISKTQCLVFNKITFFQNHESIRGEIIVKCTRYSITGKSIRYQTVYKPQKLEYSTSTQDPKPSRSAVSGVEPRDVSRLWWSTFPVLGLLTTGLDIRCFCSAMTSTMTSLLWLPILARALPPTSASPIEPDSNLSHA